MSIDDEDIGLSAEEQAQFDSMRESGALPAGSNIQSPDQLTPPAPPTPEPLSTSVDTPKPPPTPPPAPEPEDPDVETVRDATGKEVIDARTGKPQKRVSFHKYQRAMARMGELEKRLATTHEERARIDERALAIWEKVLGPEDLAATPSPACFKTRATLRGLGRSSSVPLAIREKALGADHPDTALSLSSLAGLLEDHGEFEGALPLYERALAIYEKVLGPEHRDTNRVRSALVRARGPGG